MANLKDFETENIPKLHLCRDLSGDTASLSGKNGMIPPFYKSDTP
ncbi:hypothetical protein [Bifidobacterium sp.]|jgi:hypothetical protein|nr:hypothetical protein [Bifidobacterium sp.]